MAKQDKGKYAANKKAIQDSRVLCDRHPLIYRLPNFALVMDKIALVMGQDEWIRAEATSRISLYSQEQSITITVWPNIRRKASPVQWAYVFARMRLHIALNHLDPDKQHISWHQACWYLAEQVMTNIGIGSRPGSFPPLLTGLPRGNETVLAHFLAEDKKASAGLEKLSFSVPNHPFWNFPEHFTLSQEIRDGNTACYASGIRAAVKQAIQTASGISREGGKIADTPARRARDWMMSEYPLLAALAASFTIIEDLEICRSMNIEVAAINDQTQEIYLNPHGGLKNDWEFAETRFVIAHEFLHSGLRHMQRRQGRDPWLWNVACDYVVNDWLIDMQVGTPPEDLGYLYDPDLKGMSVEEIYDRIVTDLRWQRKLKKARTMNGNKPDMIEGEKSAGWWHAGGGMDLDAFYRRALSEGLELHLEGGRSLLPAGLVEEIRSLMQPPIPWDVELGQWLDQFFPLLEKRRSYARAHRRQSATPDIPRPAWISPDNEKAARVFGTVVDTSGSMSRADLGKAIGAIASYAMSRDVGLVRLIQCDAAPHDSGYIEPETLLDRIQIKGRGGTVLMPGIRLLEQADDFPDDAPILILTDGFCDTLTIRHNHAYLLSSGGRLPFKPKAPIFQFS